MGDEYRRPGRDFISYVQAYIRKEDTVLAGLTWISYSNFVRLLNRHSDLPMVTVHHVHHKMISYSWNGNDDIESAQIIIGPSYHIIPQLFYSF